MSHERRLDGLERRVIKLDGGLECRTCGYPTTDGSRGIQIVRRTAGVPDDFPPIPTCTDCGNQIDTRSLYVAEFELIILESRNECDSECGIQAAAATAVRT
jgi:hypothetical protein